MTIGSGSKFFSSGFDLNFWAKDRMNVFNSVLELQELQKRVLTLGIPTMCVFNGHSVAGGLLLGLTHDFRIMKKGPYVTSLPELNLGIPLNPGYTAVTKGALEHHVAKLLGFGGKFSPEESL